MQVIYISYGVEKTATVSRISSDGKILFLDNGRWIHAESARLK